MHIYFFFLLSRLPPRSTLFAYTTLFRSSDDARVRRVVPNVRRAAVGQGDRSHPQARGRQPKRIRALSQCTAEARQRMGARRERSEEHTSELQSPDHLVCRLLLEKKKTN